MIRIGDVVLITGFNGVASARVGQTAVVVRSGVSSTLWVKFSDGKENAWRKMFLEKVTEGGENGREKYSANGNCKIETR